MLNVVKNLLYHGCRRRSFVPTMTYLFLVPLLRVIAHEKTDEEN
jgi:hypothetical protein